MRRDYSSWGVTFREYERRKKLRAQGKCVPCRGTGQHRYPHPQGYVTHAVCLSCGGTGKATKTEE